VRYNGNKKNKNYDKNYYNMEQPMNHGFNNKFA